MKLKLFFLAVLLLPICCLQHAFAQTNYYVDGSTGNDSNNGNSLGTAWKTIQKACNAATPNSIVHIKAGTYKENITVNVSGTAGNPITFKNYQNDVVIIDGAGTSGSILLTIIDKSFLNFENLTLQHLTKNGAKGIFIEGTANATVSSLTFSTLIINNINWTSNASTTPTSNDNAQPFIVYGRGTSAAKAIKNVTVKNCEFFSNITGFSEALSLDGNIDGFLIQNNRIHDNVNIGILVAGNYGECSVPALDHARNGTIENNTCYNDHSFYATSAGIYVDGGHHVLIQKNSTYGNGYGIEIGCEENGTTEDITVINNLIYANTEAGISVGGYTTATTGQVLNCLIRNNTFFQNKTSKDGFGEFYITKASNCIFENNIIYTTTDEIGMSVDNISPQTGNVFNYNCWFSPSADPSKLTIQWRNTTYNSFADYKTGTSQDANSIYSNPSLSNNTLPLPDLHLVAGSPCINAGKPTTVILNGETDYDGNPRIATIIEIGAFEFNTSITGMDQLKTNTVVSIYPNPFQSETVIYFDAALENICVKIYSVDGKEVREIKQNFGSQVKIDAGNLNDGLYFYHIFQNDQFVKNGKLMKD